MVFGSRLTPRCDWSFWIFRKRVGNKQWNQVLTMVLNTSVHGDISVLSTDVWWFMFLVRILTRCIGFLCTCIHGELDTITYSSILFIPSAISFGLCWVWNATCPISLLLGLDHYFWCIQTYAFLYILSRYLRLRMCRKMVNFARLTLLSYKTCLQGDPLATANW